MHIIFHNSHSLIKQILSTRTQIDTQKLSVTKSKAVTKNSHLHNSYSKQKLI